MASLPACTGEKRAGLARSLELGHTPGSMDAATTGAGLTVNLHSQQVLDVLILNPEGGVAIVTLHRAGTELRRVKPVAHNVTTGK